MPCREQLQQTFVSCVLHAGHCMLLPVGFKSDVCDLFLFRLGILRLQRIHLDR
jgi:hypothetical protein